MEQQLSLFIRDEVMTWYTYFNKAQQTDILFRQHVGSNIDLVVGRAEHLACRTPEDQEEKVSSASYSDVASMKLMHCHTGWRYTS